MLRYLTNIKHLKILCHDNIMPDVEVLKESLLRYMTDLKVVHLLPAWNAEWHYDESTAWTGPLEDPKYERRLVRRFQKTIVELRKEDGRCLAKVLMHGWREMKARNVGELNEGLWKKQWDYIEEASCDEEEESGDEEQGNSNGEESDVEAA